MSNINNEDYEVRIPNLPLGRMVDENGMPTEEETNFRQALIALLQLNFGNEGLVPPAHDATNIALIAAGQQQNQGASDSPTYTMKPGSILYDITTLSLVVNLPATLGGAPLIRTFTVV